MTLKLSGNVNNLYLPSCEEMKEFDTTTIASGIPSINLMESAGKKMSEIIITKYLKKSRSDAVVTVLCGSGNNGGDGLVVARLLKPRFGIYRFHRQAHI